MQTTNKSAVILPDYKRSIQRLVFAVIVDAADAASKGNTDAREWIQSDGIIWIDGAFDVWIPPERVEQWIERGCPLPKGLEHTAPERPSPASWNVTARYTD